MSVSDLPGLNAFLNGLAALLLFSGYLGIRRKNVTGHRTCMLAALLVSCAFLTSYLIYHYTVGSVPYRGQGGARVVYFAILLTHTVLAAAIVPLVLVTVVRALRGRFDRHARIARWTLPLWIYVSITGVLIYLMLYRFS